MDTLVVSVALLFLVGVLGSGAVLFGWVGVRVSDESQAAGCFVYAMAGALGLLALLALWLTVVMVRSGD